MAIKTNINGLLVSRPGVYSSIVSGVTNPPATLPYGNLCIIDTGFGAGYGGGSGINGYYSSHLNSIYKFSGSDDWAAFVKGGDLWNLTTPLWKPYQKVNGVNNLYYIRACTTTPASLLISALANGQITFKVKDEGIIGNGVIINGNLTQGHAVKLTAGIFDTTKFIFTFYIGTYRGFDSVNNIENSLTSDNSKPLVTVTSKEVASLQEFITWANNTNDFTSLYEISSYTLSTLSAPANVLATPSNTGGTLVDGTYQYKVTALNSNGETIGSSQSSGTVASSGANTGSVTVTWNVVSGATSYRVYRTNGTTKYFTVTGGSTATFTDSNYNGGVIGVIPSTNTATTNGTLVSGDITSLAGYNLFAGGTETYGPQDFLDTLSSITNLDNNFFLSLEYGNNATSANNFSILDFIQNSANFEKFLVVGGGADKSTFIGSNSSTYAATTYNSDNVIVVHGQCKKKKLSTPGFKVYSQLYKAALITARLCGLAPQVPVTLKALGIDGEVHPLSDQEIEAAIDAGVFYTNYDYELNNFVSGLDINTLQNNDNLINEDGTSYNIAIKRITAYLNRLIIVAAKQRFFSTEQGPNRNTISVEEITAWLEGFLKSLTASVLQDNLILKVGDIAVSLQGTSYFINYSFVPNSEISQLIFTGTVLNS